MAERLREVAEIPQQFVKEGSLVSPPFFPHLLLPISARVLTVELVH